MSKKETGDNMFSDYITALRLWSSRSSLFLLSSSILLLVTSFTLVMILIMRRDSPHVEKYDLYPLVSKRVFLENPNDVIVNFVPLRKALRSYVEAQEGKVGVYFEYLPSGVSIGIKATEEVRLASLSKVPLAMSILKKVERGQLKLSDPITLKEEHLDKRFGDLWKSGAGTQMTIEDLLKLSIQKSDNTAYQTLFSMLTNKEVEEVYQNLEIEVVSSTSSPLVSPKSFSSIFRSLYLASYLLESDSNYLLKVLTETAFKDKIPAGVPPSVLVAHKIGVFDRTDSPEKVYTDCGIVYEPLRPYILCIFVQDTDTAAIKHMSIISKMVYGYVHIVGGGVR